MGPKRKKQTPEGASKGSEKLSSEATPGKKPKPNHKKTKVSTVTKETPGTSNATELPKEQTPADLPQISVVLEIPREQTSAEELPGLSEVTEIPTEQTPAEEPPGFSRVTEFPGEQSTDKELSGASNIVEIPKDQSNEENHHDDNEEVMKKDERQQKEFSNSDKNNDLQPDQQEKDNDAKQGTIQTNLQTTGELAGVVFMCNSQTKPECYKYMIMAFPNSKRSLVLKIRPEFKLFLFDYQEKLLYGIYKPASPGGLRIEPAAFNGLFPAQVRFRVDRECPPLPFRVLGEFLDNPALGGRPSSLKCELTIEQVARLSAMFIQNSPDPRSLPVAQPRQFQPGEMDPKAVAFDPKLQARANAIMPPRPSVPPREMASNLNNWAGANTMMPPRPFMGGRMDPRAMNLPFRPGQMDPRVMALNPNIQAGRNVIMPLRPSVPGQPVPFHQHLANFPHAVNVPALRPVSRTPAPTSGSTQMDSGLATDKAGRPDAVTVSKKASPSLTDVALSNLSLLSASYRQAPNPQPQHPAPAPKQPPASAPSHTPSQETHMPGLIQDVTRLGSQQRVPMADPQLVYSEDRKYSLMHVPAEAARKPSASSASPHRKSMAADQTKPGHGREVEYRDRNMDRSQLDVIDRILAVPAVKATSDYRSRQQQRAGGNLEVDSLPVSSRYSFDGPSVKYR